MKRDKNYLSNKAATKNPKNFSLALYRDEKGVLHALGGETMMLDKTGRRERWINVDTRDFVSLINKQGIKAL